ncbi:dTDP-4-dehydrorhamnose reductase [Maribacter aurantiacus]|uniref:dTDP-4-dehydrorhamnose reductase n=1 Tax=Maribacter aurantiacus TaxID=1882343 RepID=A0A5R8M6D4_9FLAO|nr:dTDP-4-dehydrorhamnose reductase [Maribacter aurantiacus]TLF45142.1 dTDP-4-dehydrorhamnose reductase [Maribacter aurantiacus]
MQRKKRVLVTGGSGQLGTTLGKSVSSVAETIEFVFASSKDLDITDDRSVTDYMKQGDFDYCVNCAAYTQVDKAEADSEKALLINQQGAKNLAKACHAGNIVLIHISTDFVFNGSKSSPYVETDRPSPLGIYGHSKFKGEQEVVRNMERYFIIRTSWLYSAYGHNFFKSMLKYGKEREELSVVFDQVGTPTSAHDLAGIILKIISEEIDTYGIYHFSNEGVASWYDFASAIFEINQIEVDLRPIRSKEYPTPAERPAFSVLDKEKIKKVLKMDIPHWRESLRAVSEILSKESV